MSRDRLMIVACGRKGIGKTTETIKVIDRYVIGNARKGVKGKKVLILDVNNEKLYKKYRRIAIEDIAKFSSKRYAKIEARRIIPFHSNGQKMTLKEIASTLSHILDTFSGGLVVVEDVTKYISPNMPMDVIGNICTQRHQFNDIIIQFQLFARAGNPSIWGNTNILRWHKTDDTVERHKEKFADYEEPLKIAERLIHMKYWGGNKYFFIYFDKDDGKIKGAFTRADFDKAIDEYLSNEYKSVVKPLLDKIDITTGDKVHKTPKEAIIGKRKQLVELYYGN